jgi:hypothetical protein
MIRDHRHSLHLHSKKVVRRLAKEIRRRRPGGLPQARHSLFVTIARREAITIGMHKHAHVVERKDIMRQHVGISNPYSICLIVLRSTRRLLLSNNKFRGTERKLLSQAVHTIAPRTCSTTAS